MINQIRKMSGTNHIDLDMENYRNSMQTLLSGFFNFAERSDGEIVSYYQGTFGGTAKAKLFTG